MNNEIEEILSQLEHFNMEDYQYYDGFRLNKSQVNQLLDCITNLKQENEKLNNRINNCAEEILKEINKNNHLSIGVALAIRQKLIDYRELKENK